MNWVNACLPSISSTLPACLTNLLVDLLLEGGCLQPLSNHEVSRARPDKETMLANQELNNIKKI